MTLAGMPALHPSTPRREAVRALAVAAAAFAGGVLWVLAEATGPSPVGPLAMFSTPVAAMAPRAWALDPAAWGGWAALPRRLADITGPLYLLSLACLALAALGVIHPGTFERRASYYLPPLRRVVAWASALLAGAGAPVAARRLAAALTPEPAARALVDTGALLQTALSVTLFCAFLWTMAGPGVLNLRAALRLSHGALAGASIWAALALAALLTSPLADLAELSAVGNALVAVDVGESVPGHTYGWMLLHAAVIYALALAVAGAVAVVSAPQSLGIPPRAGSAAAAGVLLFGLVGVGWHAADRTRDIVAAAAPDVVAMFGLDTHAAPRAVILLLGDSAARRAVPPRLAQQPVALANDCAPSPAWRDRAVPAASTGNVARLDSALRRLGDGASGPAARALGCQVALLARLFEPERARRLIFDNPAPARVGFFAFWAAARGLLEPAGDTASRSWRAALADSARYHVSAAARARLTQRAAADSTSRADVEGRLAAPGAPTGWRIALVAGADPASGADPWQFAPRTDGQVLQYMAAAVAPDQGGAFAFRAVAPGWYQVALLAPEGIGPERLAALSIRGDPGQFVVPAGGRRDLGVIAVSF